MPLFEIPVSASGRTIEVNLPDELLLKAAEHGLRQKINDSYAGLRRDARAEAKLAKGDEDTDEIKELCHKAARAVVDNLESGIWREGGGGKQLSLFARCLRDCVSNILQQRLEMKRADADKAARNPKDAFKGMLETLSDRAEEPFDVEEAMATNWPKVKAQAEALEATLANTSDDLEISL